MSAGPVIELGELVLPARDAGEAAVVAQALHRAVAALWAADRAAGLAWSGELGALTLSFDEGTAGEDLGRAIASAVRDRAVAGMRR